MNNLYTKLSRWDKFPYFIKAAWALVMMVSLTTLYACGNLQSAAQATTNTAPSINAYDPNQCDQNISERELAEAAEVLETSSYGLTSSSATAGLEQAGLHGVFSEYQICLRQIADWGIDDRYPIRRVQWRMSQMFANSALNAKIAVALADEIVTADELTGLNRTELIAKMEQLGVFKAYEHASVRLLFERYVAS